MPRKTCPQCNATHGVRKLVCDCGYDFGCKRAEAAGKAVSHPLYPEPGAWIVDKVKGMSFDMAPEPLASESLDALAVKDLVGYEGLGFSIYSYIPAGRINDLQLRALWQDARIAMQKVTEYLEKFNV